VRASRMRRRSASVGNIGARRKASDQAKRNHQSDPAHASHVDTTPGDAWGGAILTAWIRRRWLSPACADSSVKWPHTCRP
jgi:hypothetical protein